MVSDTRDVGCLDPLPDLLMVIGKLYPAGGDIIKTADQFDPSRFNHLIDFVTLCVDLFDRIEGIDLGDVMDESWIMDVEQVGGWIACGQSGSLQLELF